MRLTIVFVVLVILLDWMVFSQAYATGGTPPPPPPPVVTTTSTETVLITEYKSEGVASAIAAGQCQFDWTHSWQGCAAVGFYDDNSAAAFGLGKRYDEILFNGTVSIEEGELGVGASMNWKF